MEAQLMVLTLEDLDRDPIGGEASYQAAKAASNQWRKRAESYSETIHRLRLEMQAAEKAMDYCYAAAQCLEGEMDRFNNETPKP